jgi:halimadienyl-diphosphate synthase
MAIEVRDDTRTGPREGTVAAAARPPGILLTRPVPVATGGAAVPERAETVVPFDGGGELLASPSILGTAYDTAWLAGVPSERWSRRPRYPQCLRWLADHQHPDGSWGGSVHYEHDRVISTLAALASLARFGRQPVDRARIAAGTRYLWQHAHRLAVEPMELVGFEVLLPALVRRAQQAGVALPPNLDFYARERAEKLRLIPPDLLYSTRTTLSHSLEFLGEDANVDRLRAAQDCTGAIGHAPATTAYFLARTNDRQAAAYLDRCLTIGQGAAPVLFPCETFELLWTAYPWFLTGVPADHLLSPADRASLQQALASGGVPLAPTFPIADADDTAVALILLQALGDTIDPTVLRPFAAATGHFVSFPHERHASVGVNLHVLHALLRMPDYPDATSVIDGLLDYVEAQQVSGAYWLDKWHLSPHYATAHALRIFAELPSARATRVTPLVRRAREWLRQTQAPDGGWGFYGPPTAEETALGILALTARGAEADDQTDPRPVLAAASWLAEREANETAVTYPPLWIDKCLYCPPKIVRATIGAALRAASSAGRSAVVGR